MPLVECCYEDENSPSYILSCLEVFSAIYCVYSQYRLLVKAVDRADKGVHSLPFPNIWGHEMKDFLKMDIYLLAELESKKESSPGVRSEGTDPSR